MKKLLQELIDNETGLILSAELVLVLTIAVLGVVVGLSQVQTAIVTELQDVSLAFSGMNQSYATPGFMGCGKWWGRTAFTAGSGFIDFYDGCVGNGGGGIVGGNYGAGGYGGGGYSYGGGYGSTGAYSEIGAGQSTGITCPNPTTTGVPQTISPCETCTPGGIIPGGSTPTPLPSPQHIAPTPEAPTQSLPFPPAPVPHI